MIGSLRGVVLDRLPKGELLVEVGGVGYRVTVPAGTLGALGTRGGPVFLHVHTHVREDAIVLFGFATREERDCFEALIGAHGVGPAVALAILSTHSPSELARAVATDDVDALVMVPGIGRKTAVRLLVELKARFEVGDLAAGPGPVVLPGASAPSIRAEVQAALAGLGYGPDEVREAMRDLDEAEGVESMLRSALRQAAALR
ncbi:MAG TPA: Holliday junction branch migration protein RuvA [Acidimicrobiales bacterium]|nr:Holliday junction branch migration protein RuvA [Acidimicrobiales bacterium]